MNHWEWILLAPFAFIPYVWSQSKYAKRFNDRARKRGEGRGN